MTAIADLKPRRTRGGMLPQKRVTIYLAPKYEQMKEDSRLPQPIRRRLFLGYMHELCNFADGRHTVAQIQRALGHELWPLPLEEIYDMLGDLEELGFVTFDR